MLSDTHKLITNKVYDFLEKELCVSIDHESFLYGSIVPDIHPLMMLMSHNKGSMEFVFRNIEWLISRELVSNKKRDIAKYSYKLGIVMHFISDYFCRAHNEVKYSNFISHIRYESVLKKYFAKHAEEMDPISIESNIKNNVPISNFKEFINESIMKYTSTNMSLSDDMSFSINVCKNVAYNIVSRCIKNKCLNSIRTA